MRTKVLLIAAAALAVGTVASQAQVYSQNIVGYVNNQVPNGYSVQAAPLTNSIGNTFTNLYPNYSIDQYGDGALDGVAAYVWSGHGFTEYQLLLSSPTGVVQADGATPIASPVFGPGQAFFIDNESGNAFTNTFTGTVQIDSGAYPGTSTNNVAANAAYSFLSAKIPVAGGVQTVLGLTNNIIDQYGDGLLDGEAVLVPKFTSKVIGGVTYYKAAGYTEYQYLASSSTGFVGADGQTVLPEPQIPVGSGFLFYNDNVQAVSWVQSLGQ
jgi:hypothetical protein